MNSTLHIIEHLYNNYAYIYATYMTANDEHPRLEYNP